MVEPIKKPWLVHGKNGRHNIPEISLAAEKAVAARKAECLKLHSENKMDQATLDLELKQLGDLLALIHDHVDGLFIHYNREVWPIPRTKGDLT